MNPSNQPKPKSPQYIKGGIEAIRAYMDTCEREGVPPSWTTLREFQEGQLLAQNEIESRKPDAQAEVGLLHIMDVRLNTAYQLARAATATEEGQKAIDFFYHVHLSGYTDGIDLLQKADKAAAVLAGRESNTVWHDTVLDELDYKIKEFQAIIDAKEPKRHTQYYIGEAQKRIEKFKQYKARLQPPTAGEGESV